MPVPQQKFREVVFLSLFSLSSGTDDFEGLVSLIKEQLSVSKKVVREGIEIAQIVVQHQEEIDQRIKEASQSYEFDRIPMVEKAILRLGVYEMLFDPNIPPKVAISEAMRLSRKFSSPEASQFVNAVLDSIYKKGEMAE